MAAKEYCKNPLYRQIMCTNCKNECDGTKSPCIIQSKDSSCNDNIKNCASKIYLCNFDKYEEIMLEACPSTCGNCNGSSKTTTREFNTTTVGKLSISSTKSNLKNK